ncbi:hypothetical protein [Sphingomonas phyllosphaerae]|uniref:hypothetical protein n=1 Tax=Sphingomonas phyllosphaerae TaxID=257003 RepID=UPI0018CBA2BC|nr:hypothetical protein [Sphingomonas phyllosphaerae]
MVETVMLPAVLALAMLGAGLDIDLRRLPSGHIAARTMIAGLVVTAILLPLVGLAIASCFHEEPAIAFGLALLAVSPAGLLAGPMASAAGGAAGTAVALTASSSLLYLAVAPRLIPALAIWFDVPGGMVDLPGRDILTSISGICVMPLVVGAFIRLVAPRHAPAAERIIASLIRPLLGCVLTYILLANVDALWRCSVSLFGATFLLNLLAVLLAGGVAAVAACRPADRLAIEGACLIRQEGTGIFVAAVVFDDTTAALPLIVNSMMALIVAHLLRSYRRLGRSAFVKRAVV